MKQKQSNKSIGSKHTLGGSKKDTNSVSTKRESLKTQPPTLLVPNHNESPSNKRQMLKEKERKQDISENRSVKSRKS